MNQYRLLDVFLSGPLQILVSQYITNNDFLFYFILITGFCTILYNGHNYLFFNSTIKKPIKVLKPFVDIKNGKTQSHRIYNLIIMYPIFTYVLVNISMPSFVYWMFMANILFGFSYNLFYYIFIKYYL